MQILTITLSIHVFQLLSPSLIMRKRHLPDGYYNKRQWHLCDLRLGLIQQNDMIDYHIFVHDQLQNVKALRDPHKSRSVVCKGANFKHGILLYGVGENESVSREDCELFLVRIEDS